MVHETRSFLQKTLYSSTEGYNKINNWPLNFLRTGNYGRSEGNVSNRTAHGVWWSDTSYLTVGGYNLFTRPANATPQNGFNRGNGKAIATVVTILGVDVGRVRAHIIPTRSRTASRQPPETICGAIANEAVRTTIVARTEKVESICPGN